jgi:hypothetical protein
MRADVLEMLGGHIHPFGKVNLQLRRSYLFIEPLQVKPPNSAGSYLLQKFVELGFREKLPSELLPRGSLVRLDS